MFEARWCVERFAIHLYQYVHLCIHVCLLVPSKHSNIHGTLRPYELPTTCKIHHPNKSTPPARKTSTTEWAACWMLIGTHRKCKERWRQPCLHHQRVRQRRLQLERQPARLPQSIRQAVAAIRATRAAMMICTPS